MIRIPLLLLATLLLGACAGSKRDTDASTNPTAVEGSGRFLGIFGRSESKPLPKKVMGRLDMEMLVTPQPVDLSKHRRLTVVLKLSNASKKMVQLDFPTEQRIDIFLKRADGTVITQWSEDHAFAEAASVVAINPGERLQYTASISTRDLEPGKEYILEGLFPNYDELKAVERFVPEG